MELDGTLELVVLKAPKWIFEKKCCLSPEVAPQNNLQTLMRAFSYGTIFSLPDYNHQLHQHIIDNKVFLSFFFFLSFFLWWQNLSLFTKSFHLTGSEMCKKHRPFWFSITWKPLKKSTVRWNINLIKHILGGFLSVSAYYIQIKFSFNSSFCKTEPSTLPCHVWG